MKKTFLITLLSICFTVNAYAVTPAVSNLTRSAVGNSNVTISGLNFGTNSSIYSIEYLDFESGADETTFNEVNWTSKADSRGFIQPRYDTAKKNGGLQSMRCSFKAGKWGSIFEINHGARITSAYITYWVYPEILTENFTGSSVQWKQFRINNTSSVSDSLTTFYTNAVYNSDLSHVQAIHCNYTDSLNHDVNPSGSQWKWKWPINKWYRVEIWVVESSPGVENGTEIVRFINGTVGGRTWSSYDGNIRTRVNADDQWSWIHFGQFLGGRSLPADIWHDDVFIQFGSQARVEIGDQPIWSNCTHREIQIPTSWSDSSIDFTVNQGSFNVDDTAYVFVVDSAGNASAGHLIVFGGVVVASDDGDTTPPSAPTGLTIQ